MNFLSGDRRVEERGDTCILTLTLSLTVMNMAGENKSSLFLQQQLKDERAALTAKLNLKSEIQQRLEERHSIDEVANFLTTHASLIRQQHFLYELPRDTPIDAGATTFTLPWFLKERTIYPLECYNYCLLTSAEYTDATKKAGVSKGIVVFTFIHRYLPLS